MSSVSLLSLDYGTRKSGIAYSVEGFCFAYGTLRTDELVAFLTQWIAQKNTHGIVIGLPLHIDGSESKHSQRVRQFAKKLEQIFPDQQIILHDERLTTSEARFAGVHDIDAESARLILEDYLKQEKNRLSK